MFAIFLVLVWNIPAHPPVAHAPYVQISATPDLTPSLTPHLKKLMDSFGLAECSQHCWHGIQLGKTTLAEAKAILGADPRVTLLDGDKDCAIIWQTEVETVMWRGKICGRNWQLTDTVTWLDLDAAGSVDTHFTFLDAITIFAAPTGASCRSISPHYGSGTYTASLLFKSGTQVAFIHTLPYGSLLFGPQMPISWIRYSSLDEQHYYRPDSWQGFTSERFDLPESRKRCINAVE
jgi:hypothetical protein